MSRELLHVHMPVFNTSPKFLREAVEAVHVDMEQSGITDYTIKLLDDGSTQQDTVSAVEELSSHPRIETMRNGRNVGIGACRAMLLSQSIEEDVFAVANRDSDDITIPGSAKSELDMLESGHGIVGGSMIIRDVDGREHVRTPHFETQDLVTDIRRALIPCFNPTVMLRSDAIPIGMNYAGFRFGEDIHFQARLLAHGVRLGNTDENVCVYRRNTGSLTAQFRNGPRTVLMYANEARMLWSLSELGKPEPADRAFVYMRSVAKMLPPDAHRFMSNVVYGTR